jgi:hypothetical protein
MTNESLPRNCRCLKDKDPLTTAYRMRKGSVKTSHVKGGRMRAPPDNTHEIKDRMSSVMHPTAIVRTIGRFQRFSRVATRAAPSARGKWKKFTMGGTPPATNRRDRVTISTAAVTQVEAGSWRSNKPRNKPVNAKATTGATASAIPRIKQAIPMPAYHDGDK